MKKFISVLLVCVILFSLTGCDGLNNTVLSVGVLGEISDFDPINADSDIEKIIAANCFEGLVRINEDNSISLANATSYSIDKTGKIYTFDLNPEAEYHISDQCKQTIKALKLKKFDKKITAHDYLFGFKRFIVANPEKLNNIKNTVNFKDINSTEEIGIQVVDDYTLKFILEKADPDFLFKLATLPLFPSDEMFYNSLKEDYATDTGKVLTNGPYYVEQTETLQTTLTRCNDYTGLAKPENKSVVLYTTGSQDLLKSRFKNGTYDIYIADSGEDVGNGLTFVSYDSAVWGLGFNGDAPTGSNKVLRSIIFNTFDYSGLVLPSFASTPAKRIVPDSFILNEKSYGQGASEDLILPNDKKTAQKELKNLLKKFKTDSISMIFAVPEELKSVAEEIVGKWNVYINPEIVITITPYQTDKYKDFLDSGSYDMAIMPIISEAQTALSTLTSVTDKPFYFNNQSVVNSLYQRQNFDSDYIRTYQKAEEQIVRECLFFPLFFSGNTMYLADGVEGIFAANNCQLIYFHSATKDSHK